ncbi:MAG: LysM peptidoglycan-binding domain-containing protein [Saprospiraceae bacterium]|nr:LysM peptidoglycan-binding domain-containing protein [Saprospiraceae bacterium]
MWKTSFFWLTAFLCYNNIYATGDSLSYLTPKDTIFLSVDEFGEKIFEHHIERKQTLFSLGKFYGLSVEELYYYNPGLKENVISVGQAIKVPIPNGAIIRYKQKGFDEKNHIPVIYVVKKGDTMFGVAKRFFRMEISEVMQRNSITTETLSVGQHLLMGWMSLEGIPAEYHDVGGSPMTRRNNAMRKIYFREQGKAKEKEHQGVAFWQKQSKEDSDFYALHRYAAVNSVIEVNNPMSKVTVYVKVIGKIPDTAYDNNVAVVLSPLAAKTLGARDPRFFVKVKYY